VSATDGPATDPTRPVPLVSSASPLGTVLRRRTRHLLAVWIVGTALVTVTLQGHGLDVHALARPALPDATVLLVRRPLDDLRLRLQLAGLAGVVAVGVETARLVARDDRVRSRRAALPLAGALAGFVGGVLVGRAAGVRLALAAPDLASAPPVDPYWLAEVGLFVPVAVALGGALPGLLLAAARSGAVDRSRIVLPDTGRSLLAVALLAFASVYSPTDAATFVVAALPPFAGLGAGIAWTGLSAR
jgi:hypothetical protein